MYELNWITEHLATGHAPMSYEELDSLREQGITAIVNLCGEFCDLHRIEEGSGFEVYYLPVVDECAPDLAAMETALDWLDEAVYLNKKVLVHCRLGHGRTGTFIAAYLLRRGFDFKLAEKTMKGRNANPATYEQRSFLKKYGKQVGPLQAAPPKIDNRPGMDITPLLLAYQQLINRCDQQAAGKAVDLGCGHGDSACCYQPFELLLIESMHLSQAINKTLRQEQRQFVIERAFALASRLKELHHQHPGLTTEALVADFPEERLTCPLLESGECLVFADRPPRCRNWGRLVSEEQYREMVEAVAELSKEAYLSLTGRLAPVENLRFSSADTISGKFVQLYFQAMVSEKG
ncbi:MAG: dual specificity protein phosphatase family protein [Desulfobulbaceae bacterium]|nr:dual specificity protein phosphatase family protein [Desulfobulbaceae bacterium]